MCVYFYFLGVAEILSHGLNQRWSTWWEGRQGQPRGALVHAAQVSDQKGWCQDPKALLFPLDSLLQNRSRFPLVPSMRPYLSAESQCLLHPSPSVLCPKSLQPCIPGPLSQWPYPVTAFHFLSPAWAFNSWSSAAMVSPWNCFTGGLRYPPQLPGSVLGVRQGLVFCHLHKQQVRTLT